jgi:hypothetical protein
VLLGGRPRFFPFVSVVGSGSGCFLGRPRGRPVPDPDPRPTLVTELASPSLFGAEMIRFDVRRGDSNVASALSIAPALPRNLELVRAARFSFASAQVGQYHLSSVGTLSKGGCRQ